VQSATTRAHADTPLALPQLSTQVYDHPRARGRPTQAHARRASAAGGAARSARLRP